MSELSFSDRKMAALLDQQRELWQAHDAVGLDRANESLLAEIHDRQETLTDTVSASPVTEKPPVSLEGALELQVRAYQSGDQNLIASANDMVRDALQNREQH